MFLFPHVYDIIALFPFLFIAVVKQVESDGVAGIFPTPLSGNHRPRYACMVDAPEVIRSLHACCHILIVFSLFPLFVFVVSDSFELRQIKDLFQYLWASCSGFQTPKRPSAS